jgi:hypothetical protein
VRIIAVVINIAERSRRTTIKEGPVSIETVEHCLAAISAIEIDNLVVAGKIIDTITTGDRETNVITGNIKENITAGNSTEAIVTGNKKIQITTGDYKVDITAGNIEVKTKAGAVKIDSTTQSVEINGLLSVTLKSGTKIEHLAPMVNLGNSPVRGAVITGMPLPSHLDYVTGLPLIGSMVTFSA